MSQQWAVTSSCFTQLLHNTRTPTHISVVTHNFYISRFTLFSLCLVCLCLHQSDVCSSKQWGYPRATYIYCYDYTIVDWLLSFIYQSNHDEILKHLDWEKSVLDFFLMHHLLVAQCSSVVEMRPQWWCSWASTSSALWEALWPPRFVSFQTSLQGHWRWWRFAQCCSTYDSLRRSWKIASEALNGDRKVTGLLGICRQARCWAADDTSPTSSWMSHQEIKKKETELHSFCLSRVEMHL